MAGYINAKHSGLYTKTIFFLFIEESITRLDYLVEELNENGVLLNL